ncbi:hypothetical protein GLOIN_2v1823870 [Rhizophagus irregularis DAOM 181602=DAOM 197198]|nr:hypothetical protein GLOIN_2v1823870 [Rhizophagus irregularis DAOM 181602=DAOM 197198]
MSRNKKKSSNKRKLHKASKKKRINTKNPQQKIKHLMKKSSKWIVDKLQLLLIPDKLLPPKKKRINTKNPQQKINHPIKKSSKWIVDKLQLLLIPDKLLPPKKVDILIVLRYSVPLFKGVLTISKKFINTETNQYEKSAANRDELSDEVEIVEVAREKTSTTPATGQVYQKNYRDPFVLDISQVLMESCQKSKTSQDLEESHTDKEMAKFLPYDFSSSSVEPSESLAYRYNNSDYEKLKREHSRLHDEHVYLQGRMCEVYREIIMYFSERFSEFFGKLHDFLLVDFPSENSGLKVAYT